jgi:hypothetical protein
MKNYIILCIKNLIIFYFILILPLLTPFQPNIGKSNELNGIYPTEWRQINRDGFGSITNIAPRGCTVYNETLLIGTTNLNKSVMPWNINEFFGILNGNIKNGVMCSDGCEIWSYKNNISKKLIGSDNDSILDSGFGNKNNWDCSVLISFGNFVYAGLWNPIEGGEIWRTSNLSKKWERIIYNGFNNKDNWAIWSAVIFNDYLYVGTMNYNQGCEIYRTSNGENWTAVIGGNSCTPSGFYNDSKNVFAWTLCVYESFLYVGTNGGELWKSSDGVDWKPVMAYDNILLAKYYGADLPRGFGGTIGRVGGIRRLIVFNNELYISFLGGNIYFNLTINNFNKTIYITDKLNPIQNLLHKYHGAELWKYNNTANKWTRLVGGLNWNSIFKHNFEDLSHLSGGFGETKNIYFWSMEIYNNQLYIGTFHPNCFNLNLKYALGKLKIYFLIPTGSAQIWFTEDGMNWTKCIDYGFGDYYNIGVRSLKQYNNGLIACCVNAQTGCEIWYNNY